MFNVENVCVPMFPAISNQTNLEPRVLDPSIYLTHIAYDMHSQYNCSTCQSYNSVSLTLSTLSGEIRTLNSLG